MNRREFFITSTGTILALHSGKHSPVMILPRELSIGDIITIDGKYAVNPITRQPTKFLKKFMVIAVNDSGYELAPNPDLED